MTSPNETSVIRTTEHYPATMDELLSFVATWMDLDDFVLKRHEPDTERQ